VQGSPPSLDNYTAEQHEMLIQKRKELNTCHADFVKMIRKKYKSAGQDILKYLLSKYVEYIANQAGQAADTLPSKLWVYDEESEREMFPLEKFQLLQQLTQMTAPGK
jgi:hypothetical protein